MSKRKTRSKLEREADYLSAADAYLSLTPAQIAEVAPRMDELRMREMRKAAQRVIRVRLYTLRPEWDFNEEGP